MASDERNLKKLSNKELNKLRQEVMAEEIRRIEEDPNSYVLPATASIEEDLKILDTILTKADLS
jgi:hypothetical protein